MTKQPIVMTMRSALLRGCGSCCIGGADAELRKGTCRSPEGDDGGKVGIPVALDESPP